MSDWIICQACETEFKIVSDTLEPIMCCPFCSEELELENEDEDNYWDDV
jgi:rRNA maturation endonuclease Nob1